MTGHATITVRRKQFEGIVTSDKMQKSIVVEVTRLARHPIYKKIVRKQTRFVAHDEHNDAHAGDLVRIVETRPLSKTKRWKLVKIVRRSTA